MDMCIYINVYIYTYSHCDHFGSAIFPNWLLQIPIPGGHFSRIEGPPVSVVSKGIINKLRTSIDVHLLESCRQWSWDHRLSQNLSLNEFCFRVLKDANHYRPPSLQRQSNSETSWVIFSCKSPSWPVHFSSRIAREAWSRTTIPSLFDTWILLRLKLDWTTFHLMLVSRMAIHQTHKQIYPW